MYNNYGYGGAGSFNFGRKKREANQFNNYGSGGANNYNYGTPMRGGMRMGGPQNYNPLQQDFMKNYWQRVGTSGGSLSG